MVVSGLAAMAPPVGAQQPARIWRIGFLYFAQIAQAAFRHRLPSIYLPRDFARAGGLMSYGPDFVDNFRRAATFVDKILKGAKPGELSFQQPTKYIFAINLKTARALGLAVPQSLLLRADEVFE